mgnify:CR=1 FL=1
MTTVYLMFGPQGSGKSTQGENLAEELKLPYFDAGANLRTLAKSQTDEGRALEKLMEEGKLVPNKVLKTLFYSFIKNNDCEKGLVADGFPRNEVQIELLDELAHDHRWQIVGIFINIDDETAKQRLSKRTIIVNGQAQTRDDDKPEIVSKRLATFRRETLPVVNWLRTNWKLLEIDGQPSVDEVSQSVMKAVKELKDGR